MYCVCCYDAFQNFVILALNIMKQLNSTNFENDAHTLRVYCVGEVVTLSALELDLLSYIKWYCVY